MKGRILLIAFSVPPLSSAHGLRVLYFIKYLAKFGWKLDVLTVQPSKNVPFYDTLSCRKLPKSARIYRTYAGFHRIYYDRIGSIVSNHREARGKKTAFHSASGFFKENAWLYLSHLLIPDASISWYPFGLIQGIKLVRRNKYDILISSGPPFTSHLIAYTLKRFTRLPWIVDYGDPWVYEPSYKHSNIRFWIERWLEQRLLISSSRVVVTTEETKSNYLQNYSFLDAKKVNVIPIGVDYDDFKDVAVEKSNKFRIVYAGSILKTYNVTPFLEALKRMNSSDIGENIEVIFIGGIRDEYKEAAKNAGLNYLVSFRPFVPPKKLPSLTTGADMLLLFGHRGGLQVPGGKLFHYIAARRPILYLKESDKDESIALIKYLNRGVVVDNDASTIYHEIKRLYILHREQRLEQKFNLSGVQGFSWESRVEKLSELCKGLLTKVEQGRK